VFRVSSRARAVIACLALSASLAACGAAPDPTPTGPSPDLLQALPEPATAPTTLPTTPSATPAPTTAAKPTKPAKPKPTTAKPPPRRRTATGAAAAGQTPAQIAANWVPVGGDEFDAGSLNTTKWGTYDSVGAFGNGTRSPSAISQSGGSVHITATPGDGGVSGGMADAMGQTYGRWEFRARTAFGRGFGSAILLWPDSEKLSDGEIDIVEVPFEKRDNANFILHSGSDGSDIVGGNLFGSFSQWHTFAVEWLPGSITWYVDGVQRYKVTNKAIIPTRSMHLAVQLDQGPVKDWILAPDGTTPSRINLDVDWVRVYKPAKPPV
jgi:beta-glucanase (GH16 family)